MSSWRLVIGPGWGAKQGEADRFVRFMLSCYVPRWSEKNLGRQRRAVSRMGLSCSIQRDPHEGGRPTCSSERIDEGRTLDARASEQPPHLRSGPQAAAGCRNASLVESAG